MARPPSRPTPLVLVGGRGNATEPELVEAPVAVPRIELTVEREAGHVASRTTVVDRETIRIGSHSSNDLVLEDPQVSRFHCMLTKTDAGWRVTDSGSLNGTRLAGLRVRDADLKLPESRLEVGQSTIGVRELASASSVEVAQQVALGALYGMSLPMRRLFDLVKRVAKSEVDVLIEGESGTGKELVAAEIVRFSSRANKPFVIVDCGAISPNVIESELFGHAKGAFTGADKARIGAFEAADGGTVFLDEIGELPLDMQPKLLRAIAQREVRKVGETQSRKVDVRVVAATNRNLEREVNHGRFREDLFFRLSVVSLRVPPLRERIGDIPILVNHFLESLDALEHADLFGPSTMDEMMRHEWPGNVRELRNFVERRVVLGDGADRHASESSVPEASGKLDVDIEVPFRAAKDELIATFERAYLKALLAWSEGNVSRAARKANLDRMYLHRLLQRYGLKRGAPLED